MKTVNHNLEQGIAVFCTFVCLDMAEDFFRAALNQQSKDIELNRTYKQHMYIIDGEFKRLKKWIKQTDIDTQMNFGEASELFKELMLQVIDAGDEKPDVARMVLNFANGFQKQLNINKKIFGV